MTDRAAAVWASKPKRYFRTTGEILDEDAGWDGDGTRRMSGAVHASYLVPNDPALIEVLPTVHRLFEDFGVSGTVRADGQRPEFTARAVNLYRELLRSFDEATRARRRNDGRGFLVAMSRSFSIVQATYQLAAERETERAGERATTEPAGTGPAATGYEKRFGFTVSTVFVLLGSAGFVTLGLLPFGGTPRPAGIAAVIFFGACGLLCLWDLAQRRITLRVDAVGVTLGGRPLNYRKTTKRLPWSDIRRVVLFRVAGIIKHVGLEPWTGAGVRTELSVSDQLNQLLAPQVPAAVIQHSIMVQGWRLDRDRLVAAVRDFAPSVEIVEVG